MSQRPVSYTPTQLAISAKATTGFGNPILARGYNKIAYTFSTASSANLTVKIQGSIGEVCPDFTAAASSTNRWFYCDLAILDNAGTITDGDTGIIWTGTDATRGVNVNVDVLDYVNIHVSARSAGSVSADLTLS